MFPLNTLLIYRMHTFNQYLVVIVYVPVLVRLSTDWYTPGLPADSRLHAVHSLYFVRSFDVIKRIAEIELTISLQERSPTMVLSSRQVRRKDIVLEISPLNPLTYTIIYSNVRLVF